MDAELIHHDLGITRRLDASLPEDVAPPEDAHDAAWFGALGQPCGPEQRCDEGLSCSSAYLCVEEGELPIDPCEEVTCDADRECVVEGSVAECQCPEGYIPAGEGCEPLVAPEPMLCADMDAMEEAEMLEHRSEHFDIFYLEGTAAARDIEEIAQQKEADLEHLEALLGVEEDRRISLTLLPNPLAAREHDVALGAIPHPPQMWELYLDDPSSYEQTRRGHKLAHILAWHFDPEWSDGRLMFTYEGLAELLDLSGRDQHRVFLSELRLYGYPLTMLPLEELLTLNEDDIECGWRGKAGSFMRHLLDLDPDPEALRGFYQAVRVIGRGPRTETEGGFSLEGEGLERFIDQLLHEHYGIGLKDFKAGWLEALEARLEDLERFSEADEREIRALIAARDQAMVGGDADLYRATLTGFHCDVLSDEVQGRLATQMTRAPASVQTEVEEIIPFSAYSFPLAYVITHQTREGRGERVDIILERYPQGWRILQAGDEG